MMEICGKCMGTGIAGHSDSGAICDCDGGMIDTQDKAGLTFDEMFDTLMDVEDNATGAWMAIQAQAVNIEALRQRAEAAEALAANYQAMYEHNLTVMADASAALTARLDAEWNAAIEAAVEDVKEWGVSFGEFADVDPSYVADCIRALRR